MTSMGPPIVNNINTVAVVIKLFPSPAITTHVTHEFFANIVLYDIIEFCTNLTKV
jgi:hypothetical protein